MNIQSGVNKVSKDIRDFDYHRSFGTTGLIQLPDNFSVDSGLTMPDQNADGYPYACTGYTQTDICTDEDSVLYDPIYTYKHTPPYDNGGRDLRDALKNIISFGPQSKIGIPGTRRLAYFNVRPTGSLDWFDAMRVAIYISRNENRSISTGTPWFEEFENPLLGGILPTPVWDIGRASWHNWKIPGWKTIGGSVYLISKSWQGRGYGDSGYAYVSRELFNAMMGVSGTAAFTVSKVIPASIQTVELTWFETAVSYIANSLHL